MQRGLGRKPNGYRGIPCQAAGGGQNRDPVLAPVGVACCLIFEQQNDKEEGLACLSFFGISVSDQLDIRRPAECYL